MTAPPREDINPDGVDRCQIRRMLELSPIERVRQVEEWVNGIMELRALQNQRTGHGEVR